MHLNCSADDLLRQFFFNKCCGLSIVNDSLNLISLRLTGSVAGMVTDPDFISQLSTHLFWDVDQSALNPESHAGFLICRIVERGSSEEVRLVWNYYGEERIRQELLRAPSLSRRTIHFFAKQFHLSCEAFRAYQRGQNWVR